MNRRFATAWRGCLQDLPVALISALSGCLWTVFGLRYLESIDFFNYRDLGFLIWPLRWGTAGLILYSLGVYVAAWLLRQVYSRRALGFEPSFLMISGAVGLVLGCLAQWFWIKSAVPLLWTTWILGGVVSVLAMLAACQIKHPKAASPQVKLLRLGLPVLLVLLLLCLNYNSYPGANAPAPAREQWGIEHLSEYNYVVRNFKTCKPVVDRIGRVEFVAPTEGVNFIADEGGSGRHGELTLEIVGSSESAIAHFDFVLSASSLSDVELSYKNRVEKLSCFDPDG